MAATNLKRKPPEPPARQQPAEQLPQGAVATATRAGDIVAQLRAELESAQLSIQHALDLISEEEGSE